MPMAVFAYFIYASTSGSKLTYIHFWVIAWQQINNKKMNLK